MEIENFRYYHIKIFVGIYALSLFSHLSWTAFPFSLPFHFGTGLLLFRYGMHSQFGCYIHNYVDLYKCQTSKRLIHDTTVSASLYGIVLYFLGLFVSS